MWTLGKREVITQIPLGQNEGKKTWKGNLWEIKASLMKPVLCVWQPGNLLTKVLLHLLLIVAFISERVYQHDAQERHSLVLRTIYQATQS